MSIMQPTVCFLDNGARHINLQSVHKVNDDFKKKVLKNIIENEDVLFHWATDWEEEEATALLKLVADLFVTIRPRGFAFVSSWMELRKQETKKSTQKSKGVRKRLLATGNRLSKLIYCTCMHT